jgi:hypothetical protein
MLRKAATPGLSGSAAHHQASVPYKSGNATQTIEDTGELRGPALARTPRSERLDALGFWVVFLPVPALS